jgi:hypothetical protein
MKQRSLTGAVITVVVIIGVIIGGFSVFKSFFHHEYRGENITFVWLDIEGLEDTDLSISFSNTTSLAYSIDVFTYESALSYGLFSQQPGTFEDTLHVRIWPDIRIRVLNITLRSGVRYNIDIDQGINIRSSFSFKHNASLLSKLTYDATGNVTFILDEDTYSPVEHWTEIRIGERISPAYIDLYANLPLGVHGVLDYSSEATFTLLSNNGWSIQGSNRLATYSSGDPLKEVLFDLKATSRYLVWLSV